MKKLLCLSMLAISLPFNMAHSEVTEFGGYHARFKGDGDLQPPECQVDVPLQANESFFIQWNCNDNESSPDELRSEVWIVKKNSPIPNKIADFLGFPASVKIEKAHLIDESQIQSDIDRNRVQDQSFESFLPIGIRLVVRDRSGTASLSPVLTVEAGSPTTSGSSCKLSVQTDPVPSSIDFTGMPALYMEADSISSSTSSTIAGNTTVRSSQSFTFNTCEIQEICSNPSASFNFQFTLQNNSSGTLTLLENNGTQTSVPLQGTAQQEGRSSSINMNGKTNLSSGVGANFSLICLN